MAMDRLIQLAMGYPCSTDIPYPDYPITWN